jgi:hypothetical protein
MLKRLPLSPAGEELGKLLARLRRHRTLRLQVKGPALNPEQVGQEPLGVLAGRLEASILKEANARSEQAPDGLAR